jgi:hypothetical protein
MFQGYKLEDATFSNGLFLQKNTALGNQQGREWANIAFFSGKKQANYLEFLKILPETHLNLKIRHVTPPCNF